MTTLEVRDDGAVYDLSDLRTLGAEVTKLKDRAALRVREIGGADAERFGQAMASLPTPGIASELAKAIAFDPVALMARAWVQVAQVRKAIADSRARPGVRVEAPALPRHEIEGCLRPHLVLTVHGVDWCDIELEVKLKAGLDSVVLTFVDGALAEVRPAVVDASVTLAVDGVELPAFKRTLAFKACYVRAKATAAAA